MNDNPFSRDLGTEEFWRMVRGASSIGGNLLSAEQAITDHFRARMLDLIGEDENIIDAVNAHVDCRIVKWRNALRAELRQKVNEL